MHKFFVASDNIDSENILISGDDVLHITKVLRLRAGEKILICDGKENEYICSISELNKKNIICKINEAYKNHTEAQVNITLFQGLPKAQKMDLIIQKCVEIGVKKFQPVVTDRVVVKLNDKDISGKIDRWRRISEEAAKQSSRGIIPEILDPVSFTEAVEMAKALDLSVIPFEGEKSSGLKEILKSNISAEKVGIFIGPEGGFEDSEIAMCFENNISPVTLGPRILRTETAGFVASTIVLYEIGDMGGNK